MKKKEIGKIKRDLEVFLKGNEKFLIVDYSNEHLNPTKYYHKVLRGNFFGFIFKIIIISLCTLLPASEFKNSFYRMLGMKIGKDVSISIGVLFDIGYPKLITIEDGAIIGTGVKILTHETTVNLIRVGRVRIGKQSLIGVRSIIRSGISIGSHSVIGMGSFVNKDVQDYELVGGVPAKRVKKLLRRK